MGKINVLRSIKLIDRKAVQGTAGGDVLCQNMLRLIRKGLFTAALATENVVQNLGGRCIFILVVLHIVRFDVPVGLEKSGKFFTIIIAASQGRTTCMGVDCFCLFYDYWPFPEPFQPK